MSVDLVISAYRESLDWVMPLREPAPGVHVRVYVYDKWDGGGMPPCWATFDSGQIYYQRLPNVGMCDHSYLHHIVEHYESLADWTVFSTDGPHDHLPEGVRMADALTPGDCLKVPWVFRAREWGPDGRLPWRLWGNRPKRGGTTWKDHYESGKVAPAVLSFVEWARRYVGLNVNGPDWPGYAPGGCPGVPRRAITYLPREFYERLREQLSHAVESEECHYMERLWVSVFSGRARYIPEESLCVNG